MTKHVINLQHIIAHNLFELCKVTALITKITKQLKIVLFSNPLKKWVKPILVGIIVYNRTIYMGYYDKTVHVLGLLLPCDRCGGVPKESQTVLEIIGGIIV